MPRLERGAVPVRKLENDLLQTDPCHNSVSDRLQDHNYTRKNVHQNLCIVPAQDSSSRPVLHERSVNIEASTCDGNILVENRVTANHQNKKSEEKTEQQNDESLCPEDDNCANQNQTFSFDDLRSNLSSIKIPMAWTKNEIKNDIKDIKDSVIYFTHTTVRACENTLKLVSVKELIVQSDLQFAVNVMGKPINLKAIGIDTEKITDIETLEQILVLLDIHNVCTGYATDLNIDSSVTTRDCANIWRHNKCPLLLPSGSMCTNCRNVVKMVNQKRQKLVEKDERLRANKNRSQRIRWTPWNLRAVKSKFKNVRQNEIRAKLKIKVYKNQLDQKRQEMSEMTEICLEKNLSNPNISEHEREAVRQIFNASKYKNKKSIRYSENWILLCLLMHMRSPKGYRFLVDNEILPLPCVRTIRRYLGAIKISCGFDPKFFELLKKSFEKKSALQKHGLLLIDEMKTRQSINVTSQSLTYSGLIDFGDQEIELECVQNRVKRQKMRKKSQERTAEVETDNSHGLPIEEMQADYGLVMMFQPLYDSYSQPIAVFASKGPVPGTVLAQLIIKSIILIEQAGGLVHGFISDGASTNRKAWSEFNVSGKFGHSKCYFEHPTDENRKIFVFSDTPHLIKNIRNRLHNKGSYKMNSDSNKIEWSYIETLFELDSKAPSQMRLCAKLSNHHLKLTSLSKMNVALAVQVFSESVANGLRFYNCFSSELDGCEETADFCEWINTLFDALNILNVNEALTEDSIHFQVIKNSLIKLDEWEARVYSEEISIEDFLTDNTAEGLRMTLSSMLEFVPYLREKYDQCSYVLSGRINQDPLEVRLTSRFFKILNKKNSMIMYI